MSKILETYVRSLEDRLKDANLEKDIFDSLMAEHYVLNLFSNGSHIYDCIQLLKPSFYVGLEKVRKILQIVYDHYPVKAVENSPKLKQKVDLLLEVFLDEDLYPAFGTSAAQQLSVYKCFAQGDHLRDYVSAICKNDSSLINGVRDALNFLHQNGYWFDPTCEDPRYRTPFNSLAQGELKCKVITSYEYSAEKEINEWLKQEIPTIKFFNQVGINVSNARSIITTTFIYE